MGNGKGGALPGVTPTGGAFSLLGKKDDVSEQEKTLAAEQKMKKEMLEKQRMRLLRRRNGGLLDSMTDTGGRFLGS